MKRLSAVVALFVCVFFIGQSLWQISANAQGAATPPGVTASSDRIVIEREGATIVLEPYAENILRVTLSLKHDPAVAGPGYGI
ncbi:MAG TPA: hypothetical protein VL986_10125, partial [Terracidiphilus sp.]|nr:hypothetical protein [Terracidiphilus sp.]